MIEYSNMKRKFCRACHGLLFASLIWMATGELQTAVPKLTGSSSPFRALNDLSNHLVHDNTNGTIVKSDDWNRIAAAAPAFLPSDASTNIPLHIEFAYAGFASASPSPSPYKSEANCNAESQAFGACIAAEGNIDLIACGSCYTRSLETSTSLVKVATWNETNLNTCNDVNFLLCNTIQTCDPDCGGSTCVSEYEGLILCGVSLQLENPIREYKCELDVAFCGQVVSKAFATMVTRQMITFALALTSLVYTALC